ncbi:MAG: hypothetical protein ACJ8AO_00180 [Gemmatimonadaceae bacterium]
MQPEPWEASPTPPERPQYRPPSGIPVREEGGWRGAIASIAFHALIIFLLTSPFTVPKTLELIEQGAGGPGPAGGGGGGTRGSGGVPASERLRYIQLAPAPKPAATPAAVTPPPVPPKVEQKKPEVPKPVPPPVQQPAPAAPAAAPAEASAPVPGTGGGTGSDGTAGSGPGSGGGVGSGIGTGVGSGVGPGTGGGNDKVYPPTPTEVFLPPFPVPDKVKGSQLIAQFEVDERGKVLKCDFTPTRDGGYNRKLKDVLCGIRFRPAVRRDGTPVKGIGQITYVF